GSVPFQSSGYRFGLQLPEAGNVYQGTSVRIAGVTVGKVVSVTRSGAGGASALIQMQPEFSPIRTGAAAIVRSKTLLGEGYIELSPGSPSAPAIPDGGRLPVSRVLHRQQLFDVLKIFNPATRANVRSLFAGLSTALRGRSTSVGNVIASAGPTGANLTTVADTLNGQGPALQQLIADSGTVLSALGTRQGVMQSAVRAGNAVLDVTARQHRALAATITALPPFLTELRSASDTLGAASGDIGGAAGALDAATPQLVPALSAINTAAPTFRTLFERLPSTLTAGEHGLPALEAILHAATPSLAVVYAAARQLIPTLQLASLSRNSIVGTFANVGNLLNGVEIGQAGRPIHFAGAVTSIWNETIGGWKKKLPTNRANAYPLPDSALNVGRGGLRAYDCRNIGNPLYLPPTGTGTPPCKLQGPWTFDGVTAYYPRLQPAPP
ncbi:MAG: phospholipid/cholesterol/gamma-HCH transport system substrate-binding protein, partial [Solirubrobacteraceae bacterium]|nr:phospholipid/cholesterol/gamma-HCH transport system substrate-binding protein [Solirubrobacteraceae bacterium]